jgi:hypothetical protein
MATGMAPWKNTYLANVRHRVQTPVLTKKKKQELLFSVMGPTLHGKLSKNAGVML